MELKYKGYKTIVKHDPDCNIFYGKIENIDDLILFEADTDIKAAFHEAVDDYIEVIKCVE